MGRLTFLMLPFLFMLAAGTGKCPKGFGHWYRSGHQVNLHLSNPSCYKFVKTDFSWVQARKNCRKIGADLVTIETSGENSHLAWIIRRHSSLQYPDGHYGPWAEYEQIVEPIGFYNISLGRCNGFVASSLTARILPDNKTQDYSILTLIKTANYRYFGYWTGGNDLGREGDWRWVHHNMKLSYTNWNRGQPDNAFGRTEHCLNLMKRYGWRWNDLQCDVEIQASICEIDGE